MIPVTTLNISASKECVPIWRKVDTSKLVGYSILVFHTLTPQPSKTGFSVRYMKIFTPWSVNWPMSMVLLDLVASFSIVLYCILSSK